MHKIILFWLLIFLFTGGFSQDYINMGDRQYILTIPKNYNAKESYPILFAFHGAGGNGAQMQWGSNFDGETAEKGYFNVYPNSKVENWNEGCECNKPHRLGINDLKFVKILLNEIKSTYNINSERIYAVGFSQGGLFTQYLGCELTETFKAVAIVGATMSEPIFNNCNPSKKLSVLMIHGTQDEAIPWEGEENGSFSLVSAPNAFSKWKELNNCGNKTTTKLFHTVSPGIRISKRTTKLCDGNVKVALVKVEGGRHNWPTYQGFDATAEIIDFFESLE